MSPQERPRPAGRRSGGPRGAGAAPARAKTRNVARREVDPARVVAFETLVAVQADDAYANLVLPRLLREAKLHGRDAGFATELAYGTLRGRGTYDAVLAACVDRPLTDVDPAVLDALRLGAHQLLGMRVPAHAAVDATVDLVRSEIGQGAAGFANAVLRKLALQDLDTWLDQVAGPDAAATDPDGALGVRYSHPVWIVRALRDALRFNGRDAADLEPVLAADNARPVVTLAALPGLVTTDELRAQLPGAADDVPDGGAAQPVAVPAREPYSPYAVPMTGVPADVKAVRDGRARVQDEGSQLVALALASAPLDGPDGGRWLDLCAGPGGKSAVLGAVLGGRREAGDLPVGARLVANEVTPHRCELVRGSVAAVVRRWPGAVDVRLGDGRELADEEADLYDRVLVDAPCTGLGALRRRPEARWRRTPADLAGLAPLQRDLLRAALAAVRPGGVVAYVTCSPHPAETGLVVDDVVRKRTDVERLDARAVLGEVTQGRLSGTGPGPAVQLWPDVQGSDAMFVALLRRTA
ncbi:MAG: rRNA small subunit methyltransferase B [Actinobacteria bacterium]|nr:rRNA small subunit methyltransferase B [Actinomycetota bacterium]